MSASRRLVDLRPRWLRRGGAVDGGVYGVQFDCPCGTPPVPCACGEPTCPSRDAPGCAFSVLHVFFENPLDGGPCVAAPGVTRWRREGETFETLSLSPSLHAAGHWHGFLRNGVLEPC